MSATTSTSCFSGGLGFTKKELNDSSHFTTAAGAPHGRSGSPMPLLSVEEGLCHKAMVLRRSITETLLPRLESIDDRMRVFHRQSAALRTYYPSTAFLEFRESCKTVSRRLDYFEEGIVLRVLKDAVDAAVRAGACTAAEGARWKKSNQWPALSTFLDLELYLRTAPTPASSAAATTTVAIQPFVQALWKEARGRGLHDTWLEHFYVLREVLFGWGPGWVLQPACSASTNNVPATHPREEKKTDVEGAVVCAWESWESLSDMERLLGYRRLCCRHLTESLVGPLEASLRSVFADVFSLVAATV